LVDEAAGKLGAGGTIAKIDVDMNPSAGAAFQVRGIPSVLIVKGGVEVERVRVGSADDIVRAYEKHL
jgi:thioredoxin-like negative regulator of GroEL